MYEKTVACEMGSGPHWLKASNEARDFVTSILKKEPNERIGLEEALKHPFFSKYLNIEEEQDDEKAAGIAAGIVD